MFSVQLPGCQSANAGYGPAVTVSHAIPLNAELTGDRPPLSPPSYGLQVGLGRLLPVEPVRSPAPDKMAAAAGGADRSMCREK